MRDYLLLLSFLLCFVFQFQEAHSKDKKESHSFKIVGSTKLQTYNGKKTVEYDSINPDHLYISDFGKVGKIVLKSNFSLKVKN